eukprot:6466743-Amphidinium_carterae.1
MVSRACLYFGAASVELEPPKLISQSVKTHLVIQLLRVSSSTLSGSMFVHSSCWFKQSMSCRRVRAVPLFRLSSQPDATLSRLSQSLAYNKVQPVVPCSVP